MGWFLKFLNSSIGKKFMMAVTGSFLLIFLVVHLIGNITLFFGPCAFNAYVSALDVIKPLIRVIEVVLLAAFILHIFNGVRLWIENKIARGVTYKVNGSSENSTLFSRTMFVTGSVVFIFLVLHLGTFFWRFNVHDPEGLANHHQYFDIVVGFLQMPWYSILYIIAVILLGLSSINLTATYATIIRKPVYFRTILIMAFKVHSKLLDGIIINTLHLLKSLELFMQLLWL